MKPNFPWQAGVQRALLGSICVVILYHSLVAAPWLLHHVPTEIFRPAASALIVPYFLVLGSLFLLSLMFEKLTTANLGRLLLLLGGLSTQVLQWRLMLTMRAIRAALPPGGDSAATDWGKLHGISLGLNALSLLIAAVLCFKSRGFSTENTEGKKKSEGVERAS